jgi:hypothetical protein
MIALAPVIAGVMMFVFWLNGVQDRGPVRIEGYKPRYASAAPQIDLALAEPKECRAEPEILIAQADSMATEPR